MKKVFLLTALAAGILSSCSEDDFGTQSVVDNNTIAFATNKAKSMTRSGETVTSINKFSVSAVADDNSSFFSGEEFTYDGSSGVFKSQTPHYWPTTGTLGFYAISNIGSHAVDANNVPNYTYTNWAAEKDLVAATVKAGEKEIPYPLNFRHVTSQIYVSAEAENKKEELTYKLVSVKMTAPSTGTYSFADITGGVGTWVIDNTKTSEYSYEDALPMSFRQNGQIELSSCYWNILPVTDGDLSFKIEYQIFQNDKMISDHTGSKHKECSVKNPGLLAGKMYRYNFILPRSTNDEITFTMTMNNWEDGASTNLGSLCLNYTYDFSTKTASVSKYEGDQKYTGDIVIPESVNVDGEEFPVTGIDQSAFSSCYGLTSITIPKSVTSIGKAAFYGCKGLTSVIIPEGVTSIGNSAFKFCEYMKSISLPNTLTTIEPEAFYHCDGLETINFPNSITSIGSQAFYNCSSLTTVNLGNSITDIAESTFIFCTNLRTLTLGNSLKTIGRCGFDHCPYLTTVTIPSTVTSIGSSAFGNDTKITHVIVEAITPPAFSSYAFHPSYVEEIKVPAQSVDAYKAASGWSAFGDKIIAM